MKLYHLIFLLACAHVVYANTYHHLQEQAHNALQQDNLDQALELYKNLAAMNPADADMHYNCGYVQTRLNRNHDATISYQTTLRLQPTNTQAQLGLSKALLACGAFEQAWPLFEYRLAQPQLVQQAFGYLHIELPRIQGKRILLRSEWGLGDMVHFVRYAKLLHDLSAYVIVQAFEPLVPLFSLCTYIDKVIPVGASIPANDIQIPMLSLPLIFKTTCATIPAPIPYLQADQKLVEHWKKYVAHDTRYKIGVCWHAKPIYLEDHSTTRRSIPASLFTALAALPVRLYSLQKEHGMDELGACSNIQAMPDDFDGSHGRFMDTAALMMNMDLIISADTSIVHIAGALGKEVWVLLPYASEWRWLPNVPGYETVTPWYPNMRLFRQHTPGDWKSVMDEVKNALEQRLIVHT